MKLSEVDKAMFRGFAKRMVEGLAAGNVESTELLNLARTGPSKEEKVPRSGYSRPEVSRELADFAMTKVSP